MCFRPADAAAAAAPKCPDCGEEIKALLSGISIKKCPFCKCDFTPYLKGEKPLPGVAAPASPGAPSAPAAPGAPAAPKAPGA